MAALLKPRPVSGLYVALLHPIRMRAHPVWRTLGSTILFITHNIEEAVYVAERILVLSNKPTTVKAEIRVDLPRPRNLVDPRFVELRKEVTELIRWW